MIQSNNRTNDTIGLKKCNLDSTGQNSFAVTPQPETGLMDFGFWHGFHAKDVFGPAINSLQMFLYIVLLSNLVFLKIFFKAPQKLCLS